MAFQPGTDFLVLMSGVIVQDDMDHLAHGNVAFERVEEADEFLMAVALHVAADHRTIEDIERGEQCGCAVAFVVVLVWTAPSTASVCQSEVV